MLITIVRAYLFTDFYYDPWHPSTDLLRQTVYRRASKFHIISCHCHYQSDEHPDSDCDSDCEQNCHSHQETKNRGLSVGATIRGKYTGRKWRPLQRCLGRRWFNTLLLKWYLIVKCVCELFAMIYILAMMGLHLFSHHRPFLMDAVPMLEWHRYYMFVALLLALLLSILLPLVPRINRSYPLLYALAEMLACLECGFDQLVNHYLALLSTPTSNSTQLDELVLHSHQVIGCHPAHSSLPDVLERYYPLVARPKSATAKRGVPSQAEQASSCARGPILVGEPYLIQSLLGVRLPLFEVTINKIKLIASVTFLMFWAIKAFVVTMIIRQNIELRYPDGKQVPIRHCVMYVLEVILISSAYWSLICQIFINGLMFVISVRAATIQMGALNSCIKRYCGQLEAAQVARNLSRPQASKEPLIGLGCSHVVVVNLLRINNYILWKVRIYQQSAVVRNTGLYAWLLMNVITTLTFTLINYDKMILVDKLIASTAALFWISALVIAYMVADFDKQLTRIYSVWLSLHARLARQKSISIRKSIMKNVVLIYKPKPVVGISIGKRVTKANLLISLSWIISIVAIGVNFNQSKNRTQGLKNG